MAKDDRPRQSQQHVNVAALMGTEGSGSSAPATLASSGAPGRDSSVSRSGGGLRSQGSALFPNRPPLPVIPVPIQILDEMPMPYVHMLFTTLKYHLRLFFCSCLKETPLTVSPETGYQTPT